MPLNNYLITSITPTNGEKGVKLDSSITIMFSKDMSVDSLNSSTVALKKINGEFVQAGLSYQNRQLIIDPVTSLEGGMDYEVHLIGGASGVLSIIGEYLGVTRIYTFTTGSQAALTAPLNVKTTVTDGYPTVSWEPPNSYDLAFPLQYEVKVSTSSNTPDTDPGAVSWPSSNDISTTSVTVLNIPKKLSEGNYYTHVRAINGSEKSQWASVQFVVKAPVVEPSTPTTPTNPNPGSYFEVVESFPKANSVHLTPDKILLLLSDNVDQSTVNTDTAYIVKKNAPTKQLTTLDLMTQYGKANAVPVTYDTSFGNNIIALIPTEALEENAEYTVIVKDSVKSVSGDTLGEVFSFSFNTVFNPLFGDPEVIKNDLAGYLRAMPEKMLFKQMATVSKKAYEINSGTTTFDATQYEDGLAPYYMHEYVRHQVRYDILLNAYLQQNNSVGSSVRLGNLQVEKVVPENVDLSSTLTTYKDTIKPWLDMVHGQHNRGYAKPQSVIRGETGDAYPDFLTHADFHELGE